ncbi:hypothetical protein Bca4012_065569 [Brassica carinata]
MPDTVDHGKHFLNLELGSGSSSGTQQFETADVLPNDGSDDCEILDGTVSLMWFSGYVH